MFQLLLVKHYKFFLLLLSICVGAYSLYRWGYSVAEQKYEIEIAKQQERIVQLQNIEAKIEKEIVTVYKDRVKTVEKVRDRIIEVTPNVLREESMQCTIGPVFIGLHNAAASNQGISESSSRVDDNSTRTGSTQE